MANTLIDLDDEALEQARAYYGTTTKKDTVNRALQDAAARQRDRRHAFGEHLEQAFAEYAAMAPEEREDYERHLGAASRMLEQVGTLDEAWVRRRREWDAVRPARAA
ncbi:type II toxin-antitoxin system VapB family antitoxin [Catellatospora tritici]|uniref:type II toxin-antitoxin system VapB family antitoxin n=1 Tax=Catellatospora tritici TaxID=2851566 RepID=UPI001C2DE49F|nr:type II toxin-antitoxin system VapB family antitoxin [Catellatospora tritici]MBV1854910.1 type II toxin-antitoxin system VapB family antitoxin [Catellatospora tritici]